MKKIMLGTSDAWSMSLSSHQPSEPAYYIEDCRICGRNSVNSVHVVIECPQVALAPKWALVAENVPGISKWSSPIYTSVCTLESDLHKMHQHFRQLKTSLCLTII